MSASLLLLNKTISSPKKFIDMTEHTEMITRKFFNKYFQTITFRKYENTLLILLNNDDKEYFFEDDQGNWLSYEGTVFALDKTKMYTPEEMLSLYKNQGSHVFANGLDGHFVIKIYDSQQQKYIIISDYIKNKTNYICESNDCIMVTSFLITTSIIKKPELDYYAFNEFLWRYYILSGKSMLKGVNRLAPASIYSITNGNIFKEKYWEWPHQYSSFSFDESVSNMTACMQETAKLINQFFNKPCIDFTMGQDSRQIISGFTNQKLPFTTATFGKSDFYEVKEVREMATRHGIENYNIQLKEDYYNNIWEEFRKAIILGSCEEPGYLLSRILYMRSQNIKYGNAAINGMDGHFYKNGLWDEMYTFNLYREPKDFRIDLFLKLRVFGKDYFSAIFEKSFRNIKEESREYFTQIIKDSISGYEDSPVSVQVDKFDLYHWLNFGIAANSAANSFTTSLSPLLFRRNLEHALRVPVKWKFNLSKFQRAIVYNLDPSLAKERTDFGGVTMEPKNIFTYLPFYCRYFYHQSSRLRNKIKSKLGLPVVTHLQEAWDYKPIYKLLFENKNLKENLHFKNMNLSQITNEAEWNSYIKKFQNIHFQTIDNYENFFKIISVEFFLRKTHDFSMS